MKKMKTKLLFLKPTIVKPGVVISGYDDNNWPIITPEEYASHLVNADDRGFDKHYPVTRVTLPVGSVLVRFGRDSGRYYTDPGTDYEKLAMPYIKDSIIRWKKTYVVTKPIEVDKGIVAKGFDDVGGGIQYTSRRAKDLLKDHSLRELTFLGRIYAKICKLFKKVL